MNCIVLDSTPLGLLTQRPNAAEADECRTWLDAIDIDVILAAQILTASNLRPDITVATSNISHISLFLPAAGWRSL